VTRKEDNCNEANSKSWARDFQLNRGKFAHKDTHAREESIQRKKSEKAFLYAEWLG